jgi:hypothetical protein
MAGHPVWKTRSEYPDRLGISRGHIYCLMCLSLRHISISMHRLLRRVLHHVASLDTPQEKMGVSSTRHFRGAPSHFTSDTKAQERHIAMGTP